MSIIKKYITLFSITTCLIFLFSQNAFSQTITQTKNISISAQVGSIPTVDSGGGGGSPVIYQSGVRFSGVAYPNADIVVQKGLTQVASVKSDSSGNFTIVVPDNVENLFTLFAKDNLGLQSTLLNFPTVFYSGYLTDITGIRFAPTIITDKIAIKQKDFLAIEGTGSANSSIEIVITNNIDSQKFNLKTNDSGHYNITAPIDLPDGEYIVKSHYIGDQRFSLAIKIVVGNINLNQSEAVNNIPGDCNFDQKVTLSDFSILAYWFGKSNPPSCVDTNHDNAINLIDFSILAFYWNG